MKLFRISAVVTITILLGFIALNSHIHPFTKTSSFPEKIATSIETKETPNPLSTSPAINDAHATPPISAKAKSPPLGQASNIPKDFNGRPLYKAGQLLIIFNNEATESEIKALNSRIGGTVLERFRNPHIYNIQLPIDLTISKAMKIYQDSGLVDSVGKNTIRYPLALPNDPSYTHQWNMDVIQAPEAWEISAGDNETIVAIIDTGVNYTHPDLVANIWTNISELHGVTGVDDDDNGYIDDIHGWDFSDNDTTPSDPDGHGTHIAGIIGAVGNNSLGVTGVNWHIKLMPLKVQSDNSTGFSTSDIILAMEYASSMGAKIVNCSYGGPTFDTFELQAMIDLQTAGILAVCAAGNGNNLSMGIDNDTQPEYPASFDLTNIISVAASDSTDSITSYSNFGALSVDLLAPGDNIFSTTPTQSTSALVRHNATPPIEYTALNLEFSGTTDSNGLTKSIIDCGFGNYAAEFPNGVKGNIALIAQDQTKVFSIKITNAQNAGAVGAIIYDNFIDATPFSGTLVTNGNWIPTVAVTNSTGQALKLIPPLETVTLVNALGINGQYYYLSGTSMAVPHVSGAAALLYGINPLLSYITAKDIILRSVDPISEVTTTTVSGGRLNLLTTIKNAFSSGDINGDNTVNIGDAILSLQFLSAQNVTLCAIYPKTSADINGDQRFGLEEAIFILHKIAGL